MSWTTKPENFFSYVPICLRSLRPFETWPFFRNECLPSVWVICRKFSMNVWGIKIVMAVINDRKIAARKVRYRIWRYQVSFVGQKVRERCTLSRMQKWINLRCFGKLKQPKASQNIPRPWCCHRIYVLAKWAHLSSRIHHYSIKPFSVMVTQNKTNWIMAKCL